MNVGPDGIRECACPNSFPAHIKLFLLQRRAFRAEYGAPSVSRVVFRRSRRDFGGLLSQVFLVHYSVLAYQERHDSRIPVFRGIRKNGEATYQLSINEIIFSPTLCLVALLGEYLEVIAVERLRLVARTGVAHSLRQVTQVSKGTRSLVRRGLPIQAVLFAVVANELLSIFLLIASHAAIATNSPRPTNLTDLCACSTTSFLSQRTPANLPLIATKRSTTGRVSAKPGYKMVASSSSK